MYSFVLHFVSFNMFKYLKIRGVFKCKYSSLFANLVSGRNMLIFQVLHMKKRELKYLRKNNDQITLCKGHHSDTKDNGTGWIIALLFSFLRLPRAYYILFLSCIVWNIPLVHKELSTI